MFCALFNYKPSDAELHDWVLTTRPALKSGWLRIGRWWAGCRRCAQSCVLACVHQRREICGWTWHTLGSGFRFSYSTEYSHFVDPWCFILIGAQCIGEAGAVKAHPGKVEFEKKNVKYCPLDLESSTRKMCGWLFCFIICNENYMILSLSPQVSPWFFVV